MKISLNWLKDYVALDASVDEVSRAITFLGFEVEQVIRSGAPVLTSVVVGEVLTQPSADAPRAPGSHGAHYAPTTPLSTAPSEEIEQLADFHGYLKLASRPEWWRVRVSTR